MRLKIDSEYEECLRSRWQYCIPLDKFIIDQSIGHFYKDHRKQLLDLLEACLHHDGSKVSKYFMTVTQYMGSEIISRDDVLDLLIEFNSKHTTSDIEGIYYLIIHKAVNRYFSKADTTAIFEKYLEKYLIFGIRDIIGKYYKSKQKRMLTEELHDNMLYDNMQFDCYQNHYELERQLVEPGPFLDLSNLKPLYRQILIDAANGMRIQDSIKGLGIIGTDVVNIANRYSNAIKEQFK